MYSLNKDVNDTGRMFKNFFFFFASLFAVGFIINRIINFSSNVVAAINKKASFNTILNKVLVLILLGISIFSISLFIVEAIGHGILTSEILAYQIATVVFLFMTQFILIINYTKF
jgi:hypothetical protein